MYKSNSRLKKLFRLMVSSLNVGKSIKKITVFGYDLFVDLKLPGISKKLFIDGYRELDHTNLFCRLLGDKVNMLDLGSNFGYYTLCMFAHSAPNSRVTCLEPDPRNIDLLRQTLQANNLVNRSKIIQGAGWIEDCEVHFNFTAENNLNSVNLDKTNVNKNTVKAYSLNTLSETYGPFDCLRMDIEGAEAAVLGGNSDKFLHAMPKGAVIFLEVHPGNYLPNDRTMMDAVDKIFEAGFTTFTIITSGEKPNEEIVQSEFGCSESFQDGQYVRSVYNGVDKDTLKDWVTRTPKIIRYFYTVKT